MDKFKENFKRYFGKSFKGEAAINWDDEAARQQLLNSLATDARALLELARETIATNNMSEETINNIREAASLLSSLLLQDLESGPDGHTQIKQGVAKDRIVSTTDVEMRHGRKSSKQRFDGHKAAVATDTESQLITAVEAIAGNERAQRGEQASFGLPLWRWYLTLFENIARHRPIRAYGLSYCLFLKRALRTKAFRPSF